MKHIDIAIIVLRIQALLCLLSVVLELTYIPTYIIPSEQDSTMHFLQSRAFFMLDVRILINGLAALFLWKYALPSGRYVIATIQNDVD
jgi:hypothetical protein